MRNLEYSFAKICLDSSAYRTFKRIDLDEWFAANVMILIIWSFIALFMTVNTDLTWSLYFLIDYSIVTVISVIFYISSYLRQLEVDYNVRYKDE